MKTVKRNKIKILVFAYHIANCSSVFFFKQKEKRSKRMPEIIH